jgi:ribonuclease P protein component
MHDEENVSTEPPGSQTPPRLSGPYSDKERTQGARETPGKGAQAPVGVTGVAGMLERLKKRREFLATATGRRAARQAFVVQARPRGDDLPPRIGFTVSKRTARSAVERNRIRRRLREAASSVAEGHARSGHDYVVVARRAALTERFAELKAALASAFAQASEASKDGGPGARKAAR